MDYKLDRSNWIKVEDIHTGTDLGADIYAGKIVVGYGLFGGNIEPDVRRVSWTQLSGWLEWVSGERCTVTHIADFQMPYEDAEVGR